MASTYAGILTLTGCTVEYGGYSTSSMGYGMVEVENGDLTMSNSTNLRNSNNAGLIISGEDGNASIDNSTITLCELPIVLSSDI